MRRYLALAFSVLALTADVAQAQNLVGQMSFGRWQTADEEGPYTVGGKTYGVINAFEDQLKQEKDAFARRDICIAQNLAASSDSAGVYRIRKSSAPDMSTVSVRFNLSGQAFPKLNDYAVLSIVSDHTDDQGLLLHATKPNFSDMAIMRFNADTAVSYWVYYPSYKPAIHGGGEAIPEELESLKKIVTDCADKRAFFRQPFSPYRRVKSPV